MDGDACPQSCCGHLFPAVELSETDLLCSVGFSMFFSTQTPVNLKHWRQRGHGGFTAAMHAASNGHRDILRCGLHDCVTLCFGCLRNAP